MSELGVLGSVGKLRQRSTTFPNDLCKKRTLRFSKMANNEAHMQVSHKNLIKLMPNVTNVN